MPYRDGIFAHTSTVFPWEPLDIHLDEVAALARDFAEAFHAGDWGWIAGRCHDLGKGSEEFQAYLRVPTLGDDAGEQDVTPGRVNHSSYGAIYIDRLLKSPAGRMLAFCIAGHHAGLPNAIPADDATSKSALSSRLADNGLPHVDDPKLIFEMPLFPLKLGKREDRAFSVAFFTRMIFSCLVDADRICTTAFCDPAKAEEVSQPRPSLTELREQMDSFLHEKQQAAKDTPVNLQRRRVLKECVDAAQGVPGVYSLQVPTGGGKTLSSLAFALHHAAGRMRRVVVAIPFTSIIEQTADVYREALSHLADRALVEHHTNVVPQRQTRANQLGTENWDAPLIVTTNVQLLESLFAAATTPCRKLHRLANSVIILDEAQTLPVELLQPTLRALRELVDNYGCTIVLCTATQPALQYSEEFPIGLNITPIVKDVTTLFSSLRRVRVKHAGRLLDHELALRLNELPQVLCIVNTRRHAARLYHLLAEKADEDTIFHLSTRMCGTHRRETLAVIRKRVQEKLPCRIISTQLIEAGVDLDVPVVYRAAAGFDSIAQAAGRCNREGEAAMGTTYVFDAEEMPPEGWLLRGAKTAEELWPAHGTDPLAPVAIHEYFRVMYWKNKDKWDKEGIMDNMSMDGGTLLFQFREIASKYVLIRDNQVPVLIPYDDNAKSLQRQLESPYVDFVSQRYLQPYLVSISRQQAYEMERAGVIRLHESGVYLLLREDAYTQRIGLRVDDIGLGDCLIV